MFVLSVSINWTILSQKLQKKLLMKLFSLDLNNKCRQDLKRIGDFCKHHGNQINVLLWILPNFINYSNFFCGIGQ